MLDGVPTAFHRWGSGPVVVVPTLNLEWSDYPLGPLLERFTVVTVSPRGFLGSGRLADAAYSGEQVTGDIERVLDHLDIGTYAALGYSLNGAVASSLALDNPRVTAVVCGGFPTASSYAGLAASRRQQLAERRSDPAAWAETLEALDPAALLAFWDVVDALPAATLATGPVCPVWSWWGGADPLFDAFGGLAAHRAAMERLGRPYRELPGLDHGEALTRAGQLLPDLADWLGARGPLEPLVRRELLDP